MYDEPRAKPGSMGRFVDKSTGKAQAFIDAANERADRSTSMIWRTNATAKTPIWLQCALLWLACKVLRTDAYWPNG